MAMKRERGVGATPMSSGNEEARETIAPIVSLRTREGGGDDTRICCYPMIL